MKEPRGAESDKDSKSRKRLGIADILCFRLRSNFPQRELICVSQSESVNGRSRHHRRRRRRGAEHCMSVRDRACVPCLTSSRSPYQPSQTLTNNLRKSFKNPGRRSSSDQVESNELLIGETSRYIGNFVRIASVVVKGISSSV